MKATWTSEDVPGQQGRLAVVTGANTGLGLETARVLAARGASVVLAVRDIEKGKRAAARIAGTAPGANVMVQPSTWPRWIPSAPPPTSCGPSTRRSTC
jgi:threonine dehydrogenase-like Zn-dependent dehydrogenase